MTSTVGVIIYCMYKMRPLVEVAVVVIVVMRARVVGGESRKLKWGALVMVAGWRVGVVSE